MWKFYEDYPNNQNLINIVEYFNLDVGKHINPDIVKQKLDERILKLRDVDNKFIINDFCKLIIWLLNIIN